MMKIYKEIKFLILVLPLLIVGCSSGGSDEKTIVLFKMELSSYFSPNNLVSTLQESNEYVVVVFEDGQTSSIKSQLVSVNKGYWNIEFSFKDYTTLTVGAIGSDLQVDFSAEENSLVPLSRQFSADIPYPGLLRMTSLGRFGQGTDISSQKVSVDSGLYSSFVHGLYESGSTEVRFDYLNANGELRYSHVMEINSHDYNANLDLNLDTDVRVNNTPDELRLFLMRHRSNDHGIFMVDQYGSIRWYLDSPTVNYGVQQTARGTILWVSNRMIHEFNLEGEEVERVEIPEEYGRIHHDIVDVGDRKFLLTVNHPTEPTEEDFVILYDAAVQSVVKEWDLNESIPKSSLLWADDIDWFHNNAIELDVRDNSLLLSGQRSGVAKISEDNELVWMLTDPQRFTNAPEDIQNKILFNQYSEIITWGQHDIRLDPDSEDYYLFDNGYGRNYRHTEVFSRGVRFSVDESDLSYEVIATFGEEYGELHSPIISSIDYKSSESVLLNFGSIGYNLEFISNTERGPGWKDPQPNYGSAIQEYDFSGNLLLDIRFSGRYSEGPRAGKDPGLYRVRYATVYLK